MAKIVVKGCEGHPVLAGSYDDDAYEDTVKYLGVRLGTLTGPQSMKVATFDGNGCHIDANGNSKN